MAGHKDQCWPDEGRRAISGPLTSVTKGLSRSPADSLPRRSARIAVQTAQIPKLTVRVRFPSPAPGVKVQVRASSARASRVGVSCQAPSKVPAWSASDLTISCSG